MTHSHHERRILPYTPEQLFDLVLDIEGYPAFLPWCKRVRIHTKDDGTQILTASVTVGYKIFSEQFTSRVNYAKTPYLMITVDYLSGPLTALKNQWQFHPHKDGCEVVFDVSFGLESAFLSKVFNLVFERAVQKMVTAFEDEAARRYR